MLVPICLVKFSPNLSTFNYTSIISWRFTRNFDPWLRILIALTSYKNESNLHTSNLKKTLLCTILFKFSWTKSVIMFNIRIQPSPCHTLLFGYNCNMQEVHLYHKCHLSKLWEYTMNSTQTTRQWMIPNV